MSEESKNENIFSLYSREKTISHKDDQERKVEILLVKMTQRERSATLDIYYKERNKEERRLREEEERSRTLKKTIEISSKEQVVRGILDYQEPQRIRSADLYPFENEEKLTPEEKKQEKEKLLSEWRQERKKLLDSQELEQLREQLLEITFEGLSLLEGGRKSDFAALFFMCRDPKTREKIFKNYEEVEEVRDRRVLDWLLGELRAFRKEEFSEDEAARKEAQSPDFTQSGESPKPSESPQVSSN